MRVQLAVIEADEERAIGEDRGDKRASDIKHPFRWGCLQSALSTKIEMSDPKL